MPNPATAVARQIKFKEETTYGTIPALTGSKGLRRAEFSPNLSKDTYQSNEIRTDQQIADFRHGARRAEGTLRGELSPKAYEDFFAALLRKPFAATAALTGLTITIAVTTAPTYTLTRSTGDFLASGLKIGDVIRLTAGSFNAANLNVNLLVIGLTATVATVICVNRKALVAEGPISSATITVVGKRTWVPSSGHTDKSFSIESWFSDVGLSEMYYGMKPVSAALALPSTGMATVDFDFSGKGVSTNTSEQFTSPTAAPAFGVCAAVNGLLVVGGVAQQIVRDLSLNINGNVSGGSVVGSNEIPFQFSGRVEVSGQFTSYFDSATLRDAFLNETTVSLIALLTSDNSDTSEFLCFTMPRIKLGSASKNDAADGIVQTFTFQALLNTSGGSGTASELTTLVLQDSQAT